MKGREYRNCYNGPKKLQEMKASLNEDAKGLVRGKRSTRRVDRFGYFSYGPRSETSWKDKRKTKYHTTKLEWLEIVFDYSNNCTYNMSYLDCQQKLEALGYYVNVKHIGKWPYNEVRLTYKGTKIKIPKNAKYTT